MPGIWKEVCRSRRDRVVYNIKEEPYLNQEEEVKTYTVNIISISFNSKCLVITAN